uniref:Ig-like domain-containing protein n=1 Tax=Mola mola TaxID=94237 RepID=A0A3Q3X2K2_MOLML
YISVVFICVTIMIRLLIHVAALVHQDPPAMIKNPTEEVQMTCNHSSTDFNMIQWYKQSAGGNDMTLLGYARYSSTVVESQFVDSFKVSGDGSSLSRLHIGESRSEDSAVYFCAASSAQCCTKPPSGTKTLEITTQMQSKPHDD